jgi:hypothetical protein
MSHHLRQLHCRVLSLRTEILSLRCGFAFRMTMVGIARFTMVDS